MPRPIPHFGWPRGPFELNTEARQQARGLVAWWPALGNRRSLQWRERIRNINIATTGTWAGHSRRGTMYDVGGVGMDTGITYTSSAMTFSVWLRLSAIPAGNEYVMASATNRNIGIDNAQAIFVAFTLLSAGFAAVGELTFVTYTHDGTTGLLYQDGQQIDSQVIALAAAGSLHIGEYIAAGNDIDAWLDDVRVYDYAKTPNEVWEMYTKPWTLYKTTMVPWAIAPTAVGNPWYNYAQM